jgi:hypothetical protein
MPPRQAGICITWPSDWQSDVMHKHRHVYTTVALQSVSTTPHRITTSQDTMPLRHCTPATHHICTIHPTRAHHTKTDAALCRPHDRPPAVSSCVVPISDAERSRSYRQRNHARVLASDAARRAAVRAARASSVLCVDRTSLAAVVDTMVCLHRIRSAHASCTTCCDRTRLCMTRPHYACHAWHLCRLCPLCTTVRQPCRLWVCDAAYARV